ncbi:hypothetical protein SDJN02_09915, partial [Cucurbita argyrosperma subsp. argyrosperma]
MLLHYHSNGPILVNKSPSLWASSQNFPQVSPKSINIQARGQNSGDNDGRIPSGPFSAKFPQSFSKLRCIFQHASLANQ